MEIVESYLNELLYLLLEMAPWLLLGLFIAGILHVYMPKDSIRKNMGKKNIKSVIYAALLGIPLPLCSCGVIPTGISFHKEGASKGATVSFLISTPQTGVDSILATYSLLGLPFALIRPVVALFSGLFGGALTNFQDVRSNGNQEAINYSDSEELDLSNGRIRAMLNYAFYEFLMDIAKWLIIGFAVAALISSLLPEDFFTMYLKNEYFSMLLVLVASIPIYICATGSIPIAAVLMMKGLSPGAALVFLMAGPATNTATMAVIGKAMGRKSLLTYMGSIIFSAMFFGILINEFLPREWFTSFLNTHSVHDHEMLPYWLKLTSGILLVSLIVVGYIRKYFQNKNKTIHVLKTTNKMESKVIVEGMTCNHCKLNVEKNLSKIEGIEFVSANPDTNEVIIGGDSINLEKVKFTVEDIGYTYKGEMK